MTKYKTSDCIAFKLDTESEGIIIGINEYGSVPSYVVGPPPYASKLEQWHPGVIWDSISNSFVVIVSENNIYHRFEIHEGWW